MSAARDLVAALVAGGMDPIEASTLLARAAVEMTAVVIRKSPGAKRQEAWRERNKASQNVSPRHDDETSQSVSNRLETSQRDDASLSKKERIESKEARKRETTRGSRLPDGWTPADQDWTAACELLGEARAKSELEKFIDHWKQQPGSRGVKLDWSAAWRNWIRRAAEYGTRSGNGKTKYGIMEAADSLRRKVASFDGPASENLDLRDGARPIVAGLLPQR